jgi:hypothetical protein
VEGGAQGRETWGGLSSGQYWSPVVKDGGAQLAGGGGQELARRRRRADGGGRGRLG